MCTTTPILFKTPDIIYIYPPGNNPSWPPTIPRLLYLTVALPRRVGPPGGVARGGCPIRAGPGRLWPARKSPPVWSWPPPPTRSRTRTPLREAGRGGGKCEQVPRPDINVFVTLVVGQVNAMFTHKTFVGKRFRGHKLLHPTRGVNQGRRVYEGDSLSRREKKKSASSDSLLAPSLAPDAGEPQ